MQRKPTLKLSIPLLVLLLYGCMQPAPETMKTGILGTEVGTSTPSSLSDLANKIGGTKIERPDPGALAEVRIRIDSWSDKRITQIDDQFDNWCKSVSGRPLKDDKIVKSLEEFSITPRPSHLCIHSDGSQSAMLITQSDRKYEGFFWQNFRFFEPQGFSEYTRIRQAELQRRREEREKERQEQLAQRTKENAEREARYAAFQNDLKIGDKTDNGLVIEVKKPLALIQMCLQETITPSGVICSDPKVVWTPISKLKPQR